METTYTKSYGGVELEATFPILAKSQRACDGLEQSLGGKLGKHAVKMLRSGKIEGSIGTQISDHFEDVIANEAKDSWEGELYDPEDPDNPERKYPAGVKEYEGVFYAWALESDPAGYFLSNADADNYISMNWDHIR